MPTNFGPTRFVAAAALACCGAAAPAEAAVVTPGNVLVSNGGKVFEYTPAGAFVQAVTGDLRNGVFSESRGLAYDRLGRIHVLIRPHDGDVDMFLATYTPSTGGVQYNSISFHNHNGSTTSGDIGADANYVYAPDQVFARQGMGVIRYPLNNLKAADRVLQSLDPSDVSVGRDGLLYILGAGGTVTGVNPTTLATVRTLSIDDNFRDVEATASGDVFVLYSGQINRYSPSGTLVDSLTLPGGLKHSMALSASGKIVVGNAGDSLYFTDTSLDSFTRVLTPNSTEDAWGNLVTFAEPVPEPSALATAAVTVAGVGLLKRRRRRSA
jgi:hypothetical protein